jgi:hypothetical protein
MISFSLILALSFLKQTTAAPYTSTTTFLTARDGTGSVTSTAGLAWYDANLSDGTSGRSNPSLYTCFSGPASNFPARSSWISFNAMWALQTQDALTPIGDSAAEQQAIYNAILNVSSNAKIDPRVILAVIIDEVSRFVPSLESFHLSLVSLLAMSECHAPHPTVEYTIVVLCRHTIPPHMIRPICRRPLLEW